MVKDSLVTVVITNDAHILELGIFELICEKIRISVCVFFFLSPQYFVNVMYVVVLLIPLYGMLERLLLIVYVQM